MGRSEKSLAFGGKGCCHAARAMAVRPMRKSNPSAKHRDLCGGPVAIDPEGAGEEFAGRTVRIGGHGTPFPWTSHTNPQSMKY